MDEGSAPPGATTPPATPPEATSVEVTKTASFLEVEEKKTRTTRTGSSTSPITFRTALASLAGKKAPRVSTSYEVDPENEKSPFGAPLDESEERFEPAMYQSGLASVPEFSFKMFHNTVPDAAELGLKIQVARPDLGILAGWELWLDRAFHLRVPATCAPKTPPTSKLRTPDETFFHDVALMYYPATGHPVAGVISGGRGLIGVVLSPKHKHKSIQNHTGKARRNFVLPLVSCGCVCTVLFSCGYQEFLFRRGPVLTICLRSCVTMLNHVSRSWTRRRKKP